MNMHEWMKQYSHRMAQWRTPESSGTGAACVPLDRSRMPTYSRAAEWIESQILVDVCLDLCPFCWNVHLIWQYFVDRRKVNAWTWLLMMYIYLHIVYAHSNREFCDMNHCRTSRVSWNTVARQVCMFISRELRTRALQGRRRLLEGRDKIVIHRTSANEATQYTGNWDWTFWWLMGSSDYFPSRAKRQNA